MADGGRGATHTSGCGVLVVPGQDGDANDFALSGFTGTVALANCILGNLDSRKNIAIADWSSALFDGVYNLRSDTSFLFTATGGRNAVDPMLGPLSPNGGGTLTLSPLPGSPAVDIREPDVGSPGMDQRGVPRPQDVRFDAGSVEATFLTIRRTPGGQAELAYGGTPGLPYALEEAETLNPAGDGWRTVEHK